MEKVFVVTTGDYSDYSIRAIFTNEAKAEMYADMLRGNVEEWAVDEIAPPAHLRGMRPYYVTLYQYDGHMKAGEVPWYHGTEEFDDKVTLHEPYPWQPTVTLPGAEWQRRNHPSLETCMWARDEEHALKIARDRFNQYLAEQHGIA